MPAEPIQVLRAASGPAPAKARSRLVIAGATGALGNEVMRLLVGSQVFAATAVLAREPITAGLRGVQTGWHHPLRPANGRSLRPTWRWCCSIRRAFFSSVNGRCGLHCRSSCRRWRGGCEQAA
jgi:hypothetical protein